MIKVCFICNWGPNSKSLFEKYKTFTPSNNGEYKNVKGVDNIQEADYIIVIEGFPSNYKHNPKQKLICFPREPNLISKHKNWEHLNLQHGYTYKNMYHVVTNPQFLNKNYDFLKLLKYPKKSNILSAVVSTAHKNRSNFFIELAKKYPELCDIYGYGWKNELGKSYKGVLSNYHNTSNNNSKTKYDGLVNYQYSICIENSNQPNYFSEKFTDAILCWTIPIYCGCPNINEYFPEHSYYTIDINSNTVLEDVVKLSQQPITQLNIDALEKARSLILDKYNIWATISSIL